MRSCPAGHGSVGVEGFSGSMSWLLGVILEFFVTKEWMSFFPLRFGSSNGGRRMPPSSPCAPWGCAAGRAVSMGVRGGVSVPPVLDPRRRSADRGNRGRGDVRVQVPCMRNSFGTQEAGAKPCCVFFVRFFSGDHSY